MSEESITVVQKEKNPKRVEGEKRLALYNKAARERLMTTRDNTESVENATDRTEGNETAFPLLIIGVVGVSGLAYLYFTHKSNKKKAASTEGETEGITDQEQNQPKPVGKKKLISLD